MREDGRCRLAPQVLDRVPGVGQSAQRRGLLGDERPHERPVLVQRRPVAGRMLLECERQLRAPLGREGGEAERAQGLVEVRCPERHECFYEAGAPSPTGPRLPRASRSDTETAASARRDDRRAPYHRPLLPLESDPGRQPTLRVGLAGRAPVHGAVRVAGGLRHVGEAGPRKPRRGVTRGTCSRCRRRGLDRITRGPRSVLRGGGGAASSKSGGVARMSGPRRARARVELEHRAVPEDALELGASERATGDRALVPRGRIVQRRSSTAVDRTRRPRSGAGSCRAPRRLEPPSVELHRDPLGLPADGASTSAARRQADGAAPLRGEASPSGTRVRNRRSGRSSSQALPRSGSAHA